MFNHSIYKSYGKKYSITRFFDDLISFPETWCNVMEKTNSACKYSEILHITNTFIWVVYTCTAATS